MIHVNANLDLQSFEVLNTSELHNLLHELYTDSELRITFVARDIEFEQACWQDEGETFVRVILPYYELLQSENIPLLVLENLLEPLSKQEYLDTSELQIRLEGLIQELRQKQIESAI